MCEHEQRIALLEVEMERVLRRLDELGQSHLKQNFIHKPKPEGVTVEMRELTTEELKKRVAYFADCKLDIKYDARPCEPSPPAVL